MWPNKLVNEEILTAAYISHLCRSTCNQKKMYIHTELNYLKINYLFENNLSSFASALLVITVLAPSWWYRCVVITITTSFNLDDLSLTSPIAAWERSDYWHGYIMHTMTRLMTDKVRLIEKNLYQTSTAELQWLEQFVQQMKPWKEK